MWYGDVEGLAIHAESAGFAVGNKSSIMLNRTEYSLNQCDLNIVVYDKVHGTMIDSVRLDLHQGIVMAR